MHSNFKFMLISLALFSILLGQIDCKSFFGIGDRYLGDQLLLRDEVENRHTGLTEEPMIAFEYAIKEPITYIEIMSEENIKALVRFSYYDSIINGTLMAVASTITPDGLNQPFKVSISIYGFNDTTLPELFAAVTLRHEQYQGSLVSEPAPGEIDHLPLKMRPIEELMESNEEIENDSLEDFGEIKTDETKEEPEIELNEATDDTFESLDLYAVLGHRQKNDELIFETYQTSESITESKAEHKVIFYFIDNVYITSIEFILIDYKNNKTNEEIEHGYFITYSHFTPSTIKAVIQDFHTTSLVAKISVYGYKEELRPETYESYIPKNQQPYNSFFKRLSTTETPEMHLKMQLNALQRDADGFANIPPEFYKSQSGGEPPLTITSIREVPSNGCNNFQHFIASKLKILSLLWAAAILVYTNRNS